MKYTILFLLLIILSACEEQNETVEFIQAVDSSLPDEQLINDLNDTNNPLNSLHPSNLSPDKSWMVNLNIQEGNLLSYTIVYQNSETITKEINPDISIIGAIDYPDPKWLNDSIYDIPNAGGFTNGYYEIQIHKDGTCEYIEHSN